MKENKIINIPHVRLDSVEKSYGAKEILKGIDLSIHQGEFVAIVGKSGCGKSTLLRLLTGLETPCSGTINMFEKSLKNLNKNARIMFQDGRLLPWKRVIDNINLGLPAGERDKAMETLRSVGLADRANDWPKKLSGGQQQRVALARALIHDPELLLLDEPLGALDALTRIEMQDLIESLWKKNKFTAILVTHDVEEAVAIADRVVVIENGMIRLNKPIDLPRPRQRTQAGFAIYVEEILDQIMGRKTGKVHRLDRVQPVNLAKRVTTSVSNK